ncbi:hypothetical protein LTR16_004452, partial [Cryomyces antarcticus]
TSNTGSSNAPVVNPPGASGDSSADVAGVLASLLAGPHISDTAPAQTINTVSRNTSPAAPDKTANAQPARPASNITPNAAAAPLTIADATYSAAAAPAGSGSHYIVQGQTLVPGSSIALGSGPSPTIIALQTSNDVTQLVAGSSTFVLPTAAAAAASALFSTPIIVGSATVTANAQGAYVVQGQTLAPGHAITLGSGGGGTATVIALTTNAAGHSVLVVGGTSSTLLPPASTGLGGYILSGLGATGSASATAAATAPATRSPVQPYTGGAEACRPPMRWGMAAVVAGMEGLVLGMGGGLV